MKQLKLFTIGYEGSDIEQFSQFLKEQKIRILVDVRKNPVSRKKGFSKHKLAAHLAHDKIEYIPMPALGVPTDWRKAAKAHHITREQMFKDYQRKILPLKAKELEDILGLMEKQNTVLMCYEADAADCHRNFIASAVRRSTKNKVKVIDLILPTPAISWTKKL